MTKQAFSKDVAIIGITNILTCLGGFLLLPIITKTLGAHYYGIWAQISVTISLLSSIALLGLSMALVRFLSAENDLHRIREGFYSISVIAIFSGLAFSLTVFALSDLLANSVFSDPSTSQYIKAGSFLILLTSLDQIVMYYFRILRQIKTYAFITLFNTFGRLTLIFVLLHIGFGLMGLISAVLAIQVAALLAAVLSIISQIGFAVPKFVMVREYLRYGLPLTPNSLIKWITDSSDIYIVGIFLGVNAVGIYSAAYAIGSIVNMLLSPIQIILFPELSKMYDENRLEEVKLYLSYSIKYFLLLCIPSVVGLTVLSRAILEIFAGPEFSSGSSVIPFVATAALMAGVFQIVINVTHLVKRTQFNLLISIVAAAANILLNIMLVPVMGIMGAAISTFVSYLLMVIIVLYISSKLISFKINWMFILKSLISSLFMAGMITFIYPEKPSDLLISVILGAITYSVVIVALGGFDAWEIAMLKRQIIRGGGKL